MNNINKETNLKCTGCGACFSVCPKGAIEYKIADDGFFKAFVNENCIQCGQCVKVCAKFENTDLSGTSLQDGTLYSATGYDDETVNSCTSGGIAHFLSSFAIDNGYTVAGTVFDAENRKACVKLVTDKSGLDALKGSKYIQSDASAFKELIAAAKENSDQKFMIFGTPCQIYGIKKAFTLLKLKNECIYIDLFCHGVPSYLVFNKHLEEIERKKHIGSLQNVKFRTKQGGWHNFIIGIYGENGKYEQTCEADPFYRAFFDNVLLNESCFDCSFRKSTSYADIRLGDFWGSKFAKNDRGVSACLVLSEKGDAFIKALEENKSIQIISQEPLPSCFEGQSLHTYPQNPKRASALAALRNGASLKSSIKIYRLAFPAKRRLKLAIKESVTVLPKPLRLKVCSFYRKQR